MRQLNKQFRGKNSTTDVLSFQYESDEFESNKRQFVANEPTTLSLQDSAFLGDIVISAEQAERQAKENGLTLENEIKQLILHGLLHLCGYDHETDNGKMNARELELREKLRI
jgi:probable rRNA maturation factor